ncbi:hypothetical protein EYF80_063215 [Liparis tanakae]|uniref:Uncharacterized protein n=1 Tax=Liparis tanakae TaxID=230148 RepID=A0A4Z2ECT1_9TELE|nr:hypothetical protein EYF80_063215 [Liparis tanakae]
MTGRPVLAPMHCGAVPALLSGSTANVRLMTAVVHNVVCITPNSSLLIGYDSVLSASGLNELSSVLSLEHPRCAAEAAL